MAIKHPDKKRRGGSALAAAERKSWRCFLFPGSRATVPALIDRDSWASSGLDVFGRVFAGAAAYTLFITSFACASGL